MTRIFDPSFVEKHDLFHARYGLGAVVVAVPKGPDQDPRAARKHQGRALNMAKLFAERQESIQHFEPIRTIEEQSGIVRMTLEFKRTSPVRPGHVLGVAVIERIVPVGRVTLEIIHTDESDR